MVRKKTVRLQVASPQAQGVVLPVAKALFPVHIFVGQVQTADVAGHAVDDGDLPVVPVVLVDGQDGHQGWKTRHRIPRACKISGYFTGKVAAEPTPS